MSAAPPAPPPQRGSRTIRRALPVGTAPVVQLGTRPAPPPAPAEGAAGPTRPAALMTELMVWRLGLVGLLMAATVALVIGGGSIGAGVNAVSLSLWHFIQTAQAPARSDREATAASLPTVETGQRDAAALDHDAPSHAEAPMSQSFTLVSAASDPWPPLTAATAGVSPPRGPAPESTPSASAVSAPTAEPARVASAQADLGSPGSAQLQSVGATGVGHDEAPAGTALGDALAALGQAIRRDSRTAEAFKQRALAYASRQDADKAIESWTKAIELATAKSGRMSDLDLFMAYGSRAALYDGKHQFTREIADLTQMLESYRLKPEVAEALDEAWGAASTRQLLSSIYKQRAKASVLLALYDKATEDLGLAIELDRSRAADAYSERARIAQKLGQRGRALSDWRAALRLDPGLKEAKENLGRLEGEAGPRSSAKARGSPHEAAHEPGPRASARPAVTGTVGNAATP